MQPRKIPRLYSCETCDIRGMSEVDFIRHIKHRHSNLHNEEIALTDNEAAGPSRPRNANDSYQQSFTPNMQNHMEIVLTNYEASEMPLDLSRPRENETFGSAQEDADDLRNFKIRLCGLCGISFTHPGDLDVHRANCHPEIYNVVPSQVGCGMGVGALQFFVNSAMEESALEYVGDLTGHVLVDAKGMFLEYYSAIRELMLTTLQRLEAYLVKCIVHVEMTRNLSDGPGADQVELFPFRSYIHTCLQNQMVGNLMTLIRNKIADSIRLFLEAGSGWKVHRIVSITFKFVKYRMDRGGMWIKTPKVLKNKSCVINIRNEDNLCFKYAIKAELHPVYKDPAAHWYRVTNPKTYENVPDDIDWNCVSFPMTLNQMDKFLHFNTQLSVNIFGFEENDSLNPKNKNHVFPLFVCQEKRQKHVDLLLVIEGFNSHFMLLKQDDQNSCRGLSRLLGSYERNYEKFICKSCLHYWTSPETLEKHMQVCITNELQRVSFPKQDFYTFSHIRKTLPVPFIIYCDFECILRSHTDTENRKVGRIFSEHIDCGYSFVVVGPNGLPLEKPTTFCGPNAAKHLLKQLINITKPYFQRIKEDVGMDPRFSKTDLQRFRVHATNCIHCGTPFIDHSQVVIDHCHITGCIRGASCNSCNIQLQIAKFIPVVFHNFKNYDCHFIVQALQSEIIKRVRVLATTTEKFMSMECFTHDDNCIKFVDSFQFINSGLADQVEQLAKHDTSKFCITRHAFEESANVLDLLFKKGIYPYSYMDSFDKFDETALPSRESFKSDLTGREISTDDYAHAVAVWEAFDCKTLRDYHNLYVKLDTCLLGDCFQNLRNTMLTSLRLDCAQYVTLPGLAYDAAMLRGRVQFQYLKLDDQYMFCEKGIRGGICSVGLRHAKANNPYMGAAYDDTKPKSYLVLWDANLLYASCLWNFVPFKDFRWDPALNNRVEDLNQVIAMLMSMGDEHFEGLILEVDLDYPPELHDLHNDYPLAVERTVIDDDDMSPYTRDTATKIKAGKGKKSKLAGTFYNKRNYVIHYRLLKLYLKLGLKLVKVHRALRFSQAPLFRLYIEFCVQKRRSATNKVEKKFWKDMGNVLFGKLLQNVRKFNNVNIALTKDKLQEYAKKPTVKDFRILHDNCVLFMMKKLSICLDKHISAGLTVLDDSKLIMYDFYYNVLKPKYKEKIRLVMTDTDSFLLHIITEDVYIDMYEMMKTSSGKFDTSNFDPNHPKLGFLSSQNHQGEGGYFKDENPDTIMTEAIALKPKLYCAKNLAPDGSVDETKKAKGTIKAVVKDNLQFSDYLRVLEESTTMSLNMNTIRSMNHRVYTTSVQKQSLSALEDKSGFYTSPIESLKFGHYKIPMLQQGYVFD